MWENIFLGSLVLVLCGFSLFDLCRYRDAMKMAGRGQQSDYVMEKRNLWKRSLFFFVLCTALFILISTNLLYAKVLGVVVLAGGLLRLNIFLGRRLSNISHFRKNFEHTEDEKRRLESEEDSYLIGQILAVSVGWCIWVLILMSFFFPDLIHNVPT